MAGDNDLWLDFIYHRERLQLGFAAAYRQQPQCAVHVDDIAGDQHILLGQPHQHAPGCVSAIAAFQLHDHTSQFQAGVVASHKARRKRGHSTVQALFQHLQPFHVIASAGFYIGLGIGVGEGLDALALEIAIAELAVDLPASVDDPFDRLRGDLLGLFVNLAGSLKGGSAVNQHRACRCHYESDVGVESFVVVGASFGVTNVGIDAVGDWFENHVNRPRGQVGHQGGSDDRAIRSRMTSMVPSSLVFSVIVHTRQGAKRRRAPKIYMKYGCNPSSD